MNVVKRETFFKKSKFKSELLRKDGTNGIRGFSLPVLSYTTNVSRIANKTPRYQFTNEDSSSSRRFMGPPLGPPRSLKRKIIASSTSSKLESSSSAKARPRILASDSAAIETSFDACTPRNRPTALRYISSSSRGGYSGTRSARSTSTIVNEASVILAISEGRGMARGEIGIAAIDLRHPHLVLCQFSDTLLYTHTLTKINYFNPIEIIVPHTFCEGVQPNQLYQLIKDQYPGVTLTSVQRRHFNDATGRLNIQTLCAPQYNAVYLQVLQKFYALTAAAAVLKYVEYIQCIVFARESLKIEYHSSEDTMIIDVGTATQLELVAPLMPSAGASCCLLGVLGPLYTMGGIRALRASILQPSSNKEYIESRLDAVQDLIENESGLMVDLQDVIKKLADIDKILLLCVESTSSNMDKVGEAQLNQTLLLKTTMDLVPKIVEALRSAESGRLRKIKMDLENPHYNEIAEHIKKIIQDDAHMEKGAMGSLQRCFAVRPNINGLLDVARRTYSELIEDIQKIVEQLSETYDLPIRLNQNVMKGFHIVLPVAPKNRRNFKVEDLPPIFIQVLNNGPSVTMTTEELVVLDHQAKESLNEIQKMSNIVISSLLKELRPFMFSLYKLCENVAELDILLALAQASSVGSYIRPEFNSYLDIRNGIHPLLDYNSTVMPVANDIFASPEYNFTIITGPNMGGKSIYIKQIALLQIMAQLGCFLPATNAVIRICDRIFSRIGFNDSVELNASTFVLEMKEIQHILKGITKTSLVIIDELCRSTNENEGTSIAWAICEELIHSDAFTFFTTHFLFLTRLQDLYHNVVNRHAVVIEEATENEESSLKNLIYTHKIEPGFTKILNYGLALAAKTNLPEDTVKLATELAELTIRNETPQQIKTPEQNFETILYKFHADINMAMRQHENSNEIVNQIKRKFKADNPAVMQWLTLQRSNTTYGTDSSENDNVKNTRKYIPLRDQIPSGSHTITEDLIDVRETNPIQNNMASRNHTETAESNIETEPSDTDNKIDSNENNTTVKSSNQLLISKVNFDHKDITNNEEITENVLEENNTSVGEPTTNRNNTTPLPDLPSSSISLNEISETRELISNSYNQESDDSSSDSSSNLADALTQVIEEYSLEEETERMSLDEEFISNVVDEINAELNEQSGNVDDLILTPPMGFRD